MQPRGHLCFDEDQVAGTAHHDVGSAIGHDGLRSDIGAPSPCIETTDVVQESCRTVFLAEETREEFGESILFFARQQGLNWIVGVLSFFQYTLLKRLLN